VKRILITGGTGFFGKSILDYWGRRETFERFEKCDFTILSRHGLVDQTTKHPNNQTITSLLGDVRTFDVGSSHYDWVIHAATPARVDVSDDEMRSIIIDGTANAIAQAKKCGAEKFMMVSSGGAYGKGLTRPASENDEPHPFTAYGIAKLEAERMAAESGLFALLPRCFAFVGKYLPQDKHFAIGNFIADALAGRDIVIRGDGTPMRSYMYADDLVEWLWAILERGESGRVYNVGSDEAISIRNLAYAVRDALGSKSEVKVLGRAVAGAADYYVPDVSRIRRELGVKVKVKLKDAILNSI